MNSKPGGRRSWRTKGYDAETACRIASNVRTLRPDEGGNLIVVCEETVDPRPREIETSSKCAPLHRQAQARATGGE